MMQLLIKHKTTDEKEDTSKNRQERKRVKKIGRKIETKAETETKWCYITGGERSFQTLKRWI